MPFSTGIQLSFELAKAFPIRQVVESAGSKVLKYARDLRVSGSDIVVEADLAEVFGRGKIVPQLEQDFRDVVVVQRITYLRDGCEISLDSGAGPTLLYALRNNQHFSTIIQLSFLGWTHDRSSLATAIDQAMAKRLDMNVAGASASPGYEGILNTIAACSSQANAFAWSYYIKLVDAKLQESIPGYQYSRDLMKLSPAALTGAMDYLYIVQQLRESRKIMISNAMGSITFIVWAHYILGLNVLVTPETSSTVAFGDEQNPHVLIVWSKLIPYSASITPVSYPDEYLRQPCMQLLNEDMSVILDSQPDSDRWREIAVDTRYPLLGYGSTYLHRMFNSDIITNDLDPIYPESVKLIIAIALWVSQRVDRDMDIIVSPSETIKIPSPQKNISVEVWRMFASAKLLFANISGPAETSMIDKYVKDLAQGPLDKDSLPNTCTTFLKRVPIKRGRASPTSRYIFHLRCLASMVLVFSLVPEIQDCSAIPLREMEFSEIGFQHYFLKACKEPNERLLLRYDTIFQELKRYLSTTELPPASFLCCDFGWSVYFDSFGDRDPAEVRPELIHIRLGVPTSRKTMERKMFLSDGSWGTGISPLGRIMRDKTQLIRGRDYIPRSSATASYSEFWSTRSQSFEQTVFYRVTPHQEWRDIGHEPYQTFTQCRSMQSKLWETFTTVPCDHPPDDPKVPIKLGMDAAAVLGWMTDQGEIEEVTERFLICLTKGDPRIRWLATNSSIFLGRRSPGLELQTDPRARVREVMLRTDNCCASCALEQVAEIPGNHYWIVIL